MVTLPPTAASGDLTLHHKPSVASLRSLASLGTSSSHHLSISLSFSSGRNSQESLKRAILPPMLEEEDDNTEQVIEMGSRLGTGPSVIREFRLQDVSADDYGMLELASDISSTISLGGHLQGPNPAVQAPWYPYFKSIIVNHDTFFQIFDSLLSSTISPEVEQFYGRKFNRHCMRMIAKLNGVLRGLDTQDKASKCSTEPSTIVTSAYCEALGLADYELRLRLRWWQQVYNSEAERVRSLERSINNLIEFLKHNEAQPEGLILMSHAAAMERSQLLDRKRGLFKEMLDTCFPAQGLVENDEQTAERRVELILLPEALLKWYNDKRREVNDGWVRLMDEWDDLKRKEDQLTQGKCVFEDTICDTNIHRICTVTWSMADASEASEFRNIYFYQSMIEQALDVWV